MTKRIHISVGNKVFDEIEVIRKEENITRSECAEEMIRVGLQHYVKKNPGPIDPIM